MPSFKHVKSPLNVYSICPFLSRADTGAAAPRSPNAENYTETVFLRFFFEFLKCSPSPFSRPVLVLSGVHPSFEGGKDVKNYIYFLKFYKTPLFLTQRGSPRGTEAAEASVLNKKEYFNFSK